MPSNNILLLSTRPLPGVSLAEAKRAGITVDVLSFIETEAIQSVEVQQEIEQALSQTATVAFTSMNAVEAVATYLQEEKPDWTIYCMGQTTRELVTKYFGEASLAATADNAAELAETIAEEGYTDEVIFFCGDQRRDELPDVLRGNDIDVTEITVYHTVAVPQHIKRFYHGILFFSPSAVNSFFATNKAEAATIFFAIGDTTKAAIQKHTTNTVVTGNRPGKQNLLTRAINYFINRER